MDEPSDVLAIIAGQYNCVAEVVAERDRLQDELIHARIQLSEEMCNGQSLEGQYHDLEAERDRLRAVVAAAREFGVAHDAWHDRIERGENVRSTDDDSIRRAAALLELTDLVRQLDVSPTMGGE